VERVRYGAQERTAVVQVMDMLDGENRRSGGREIGETMDLETPSPKEQPGECAQKAPAHSFEKALSFT
jgi:hypothetical protein